ncbi:MAG: glycine/sarcosine/betaine reductase selenoprotein B family protein [Actinomycetota bacterium]
MTGGDVMMRNVGNNTPMPQFEATPWVTPKPLAEATVAIVTSAALHRPDDEGFVAGNDASYRTLDRTDRHLVLGHWSPNFDRSGFSMDLNVVYPIDRLEELADQGTIGRVAPRHFSFAGNQPDDVATVRLDTGPQVAAQLNEDGVDIVVLTPV